MLQLYRTVSCRQGSRTADNLSATCARHPRVLRGVQRRVARAHRCWHPPDTLHTPPRSSLSKNRRVARSGKPHGAPMGSQRHGWAPFRIPSSFVLAPFPPSRGPRLSGDELAHRQQLSRVLLPMRREKK